MHRRTSVIGERRTWRGRHAITSSGANFDVIKQQKYLASGGVPIRLDTRRKDTSLLETAMAILSAFGQANFMTFDFDVVLCGMSMAV
jgi:hypothetical protein